MRKKVGLTANLTAEATETPLTQETDKARKQGKETHAVASA